MENSVLVTNCSHLYEDPTAVFKVGNFVAMIIVSLLGLFANAVIIVVFMSLRTRTSTDVLMMALAFYDIFLVIVQNLYVHRNAYPYVFRQPLDARIASRVTIVAVAFEGVIHICNTYTVVLLSIDRFIHVCHSTKAKTWCTTSAAQRMQGVLLFVSIAYNAPRLYALAQVLAYGDYPVDSCFGYFQYPDDSLGSREAYTYAYDFIAYVVVVYFVPLAILCFSNVSLIRVIVKRTKFATALRSSQLNLDIASNGRADPNAAGNRAIAILVIVTAVFSVLQIPVIIDQITSRPYYDGSNAVHTISSDSVIINSSINAVMYTLSSSTFRRKFESMIACMRPQQTAQDPTGALHAAGRHTSLSTLRLPC